MTRITSLFFILLLLTQSSCNSQKSKSGDTLVEIETSFGDMVFKLYNETPEHRDNFIKLIKDGFYDDLLFHRVMENFMIQGGDPDSKDAPSGKRLGSGSNGYTIAAEFNPALFHKKGALAAARQPDSKNPERRSSGSQFYIVQGEVFSNGALDTLEMQMNYQIANKINREVFQEHEAELNQLAQAGDQDSLSMKIAELKEVALERIEAAPTFKLDSAKRAAYTTVGGYPSLDDAYTVFGEMIEGFDVLDKIAAVQTDRYDRPLEDVKMKIKIVK